MSRILHAALAGHITDGWPGVFLEYALRTLCQGSCSQRRNRNEMQTMLHRHTQMLVSQCFAQQLNIDVMHHWKHNERSPCLIHWHPRRAHRIVADAFLHRVPPSQFDATSRLASPAKAVSRHTSARIYGACTKRRKPVRVHAQLNHITPDVVT